MTTVRVILSHHNRPARAPDGTDLPDWRLHQRLIVLADTAPTKDGGHRAVPLWLPVYGNKELLSRVGRPAADAEVPSGLLETAVRLLRIAGAEVSAVHAAGCASTSPRIAPTLSPPSPGESP